MIDPRDLASALWGVFREDIESGEPVFFCFSREVVGSEFAALGLSSDSFTSAVCEAASTCFIVEGNRVSLREETFQPDPGGRSLAILLVCQQVLAVEEMVREGGLYTENAYFPRLRSLMSPNLATYSANPFLFHDFERIWQTFSKEIDACPGSSDDTVTFRFGSYTGIDKARLFPLSQALLNRSDLLEISRRCRKGALTSENVGVVWRELRGARAHLSSRGQRLLHQGPLYARVVDQVRNFVRREVTPSDASQKDVADRIGAQILCISLDSTDWNQEDYRAFLTSKVSGKRTEDAVALLAKFQAVMRDRPYVFCALGSFGDYWELSDGTVEVPPGHSILLVGNLVGLHRAAAVLDGLTPAVRLDEKRQRSLPGVSGTFVCPVDLPSDLRSGLSIRAGRIVGDGEPGLRTPYTWMGGICLDTRSRKYLRSALPHGIRFGSREFSVDEIVRVGDASVRWSGLRTIIAGLDADCSFDLRFPHGHSAKLAIGVRRFSEREHVGFSLDTSTGLLSPLLEQLGDSEASVIGFCEFNCDAPRALPVATIAALLTDLKFGLGRPLTIEECGMVLRRVAASDVPEGVKGYFEARLLQAPTAQPATLGLFLTQAVS